MGYTLVQLVQQSCGEMGLRQPAAVVGSEDNQTRQLLALATRLGKDLVREFEWQRLVKAYVFQSIASISTTGTTTVDSAQITSMGATSSLAAKYVVSSGAGIPTFAEIVTVDSSTEVTLNMPATAAGSGVTLTFAKQDFALPSGFDRMVSDTSWNRSQSAMNVGSASSQGWQWILASMINSNPYSRFRIYDGNLRITPAPTSIENFAYEYVSSYWCIASGSTSGTKAAFSADDDTYVYDDDLMLAGLKYYYLKAKKFDFGIEQKEYAEILSDRKRMDVPVGKASLAPVAPDPYAVNIPEGSWDLD